MHKDILDYQVHSRYCLHDCPHQLEDQSPRLRLCCILRPNFFRLMRVCRLLFLDKRFSRQNDAATLA